MPEYLFSNPANESELISLILSINSKKEYIKDGVSWNRVWTIPQASIDSRIDPDSAKDFTAKTANKKGSVGDLWDKSAELSSKRAQREGSDPVKEKFYKNYSKNSRGRQHIDQIKEKRNKTAVIDLTKKKVSFE